MAKWLLKHITQCLVAGVVALLPIAGLVFSLAYLESRIAASWLAHQPFYFPGCGLILGAVSVYLIGLTVSTFVGRWLWNLIDQVFVRLPVLGRLYQTLKQILGYGDGKDALFHEVILIPGRQGDELGLVTNRTTDADGQSKLIVFVPMAPNALNGRLVVIDPATARPTRLSVNDAMKALVSLGKTPVLPAEPVRPK